MNKPKKKAPINIPESPPRPNHIPVLKGGASYFHWYDDIKSQAPMTAANQKAHRIKAAPQTCGRKIAPIPNQTPNLISSGSPQS